MASESSDETKGWTPDDPNPTQAAAIAKLRRMKIRKAENEAGRKSMQDAQDAYWEAHFKAQEEQDRQRQGGTAEDFAPAESSGQPSKAEQDTPEQRMARRRRLEKMQKSKTLASRATPPPTPRTVLREYPFSQHEMDQAVQPWARVFDFRESEKLRNQMTPEEWQVRETAREILYNMAPAMPPSYRFSKSGLFTHEDDPQGLYTYTTIESAERLGSAYAEIMTRARIVPLGDQTAYIIGGWVFAARALAFGEEITLAPPDQPGS